MKKIAILQSNYIPWKGYFDLIAAVDEFILYDDMQYTRRDWRNRNKIKTPQGLHWLTVPVLVKGHFGQSIRETRIDNQINWQKKHWQTLAQHYRRATYFEEIGDWLSPFYLEREYTHLATLNRELIVAVCTYLGIATKISNSWDYALIEGKTERLASLCRQCGGTEYVSGPAAKDYIVEQVFRESNIKLSWFDYDGYREYPQLYGDFAHSVTILDLLFNCGKSSHRYLRYVK